MYRSSGATLECSACGGSALTPSTKMDPTEGSLHLRFWPKQGNKTFQVVVDRVRVCLDCGNVMPSIGAQELTELRDAIGSLRPIPE